MNNLQDFFSHSFTLNNKERFIKAHKLAAKYEGDYSACFSLALKQVRRNEKIIDNSLLLTTAMLFYFFMVNLK